jgi:hypothetical protein
MLPLYLWTLTAEIRVGYSFADYRLKPIQCFQVDHIMTAIYHFAQICSARQPTRAIDKVDQNALSAMSNIRPFERAIHFTLLVRPCRLPLPVVSIYEVMINT